MIYEADSFTKEILFFNDQESIAQIYANLFYVFSRHSFPYAFPLGKMELPVFYFKWKNYC